MELRNRQQEIIDEEGRIANGIEALITGYGRIDETVIEDVTGFARQGEGILDDLIVFFGTSENGIWNAITALQSENSIAFATQKGGDEQNPRRVLVHISSPDADQYN